ncbi:hypothetical protein ACOI1C_14110 [Bacillus sp. DJP31]|uniref:hypothetical protein n=1 Tax=Bacillus sp. DJP31 TaxID=3409789 RepID=UPI003BB56198
MNHLVVTFHNLITDLDQVSSRLESTESFHLVSVTYRDKVGAFIQIIKNPTYLTEINNNHITIEVRLGTTTLYNRQFIERYDMQVLSDEQEAEVSLSFNKETSLKLHSNTSLFFSLESFISEWNFSNTRMNSFFEGIDKSKQIFVYLPTEEKLGNPFLKIIPIMDYHAEEPENLGQIQSDLINESIQIREEYTRISTSLPVPYYFETNQPIPSGNLLLNFQQNLFFLSLLHISNKYENETFIVRGQKSVEFIWDKNFQPQHADIIYSIFSFCYGKEQTQDKLEIGRNILTTYHNDDSLGKLDLQLEKVEKTINRHFSLYVNDKIKKFFDETKKAVDEAHKYAKETREAADKVVTNINTSIIGLITAVFFGIVIMARGNKWFLILALLLHMVYFGLTYLLNRHFAKKKQEEILDLFDQSIGYISNVSEEEETEIKHMYIEPASASIDGNLKIYKRITFSLIMLMLLISVVVYFFMPNTDNGNNQSEQQNINQEEVTKDNTTTPKEEQGHTKMNQPKTSEQVDKGGTSEESPTTQKKVEENPENKVNSNKSVDDKR